LIFKKIFIFINTECNIGKSYVIIEWASLFFSFILYDIFQECYWWFCYIAVSNRIS